MTTIKRLRAMALIAAVIVGAALLALQAGNTSARQGSLANGTAGAL